MTDVWKMIETALGQLHEDKVSDLKKQFPSHAAAIQKIADADPSQGKQKYLQYAVKVLDSNQALEDEIIDVITLFHRYVNRLSNKDITSWNFTQLRDKLFDIAQGGDALSNKEKKELANEGAEKIFEDDHVFVYHIDSKTASCKYGKGTKWCITMADHDYFNSYRSGNVLFYFIMSKSRPANDPLHKVALAYQRDLENKKLRIDVFDATDKQIGEEGFYKIPEMNMDQLARGKLIMKTIEQDVKKRPINLEFRVRNAEDAKEFSPEELNKLVVYLCTDDHNRYYGNKGAQKIIKTLPKELIPQLQKTVIISKDAKALYGFAKNVKGADIKLLQRELDKLDDAKVSFDFAQNIPGADFKSAQEAVIRSNDVKMMTGFARKVNGADVKRLQAAVNASNDHDGAVAFALNVPGAEFKPLQDKLISKPTDDSAQAILDFATSVKGADIGALENALLRTKSVWTMLAFASDVEGANVAALRSRVSQIKTEEAAEVLAAFDDIPELKKWVPADESIDRIIGKVANELFAPQRFSVDKSGASGRNRGSGAKPYPVPWSLEPDDLDEGPPPIPADAKKALKVSPPQKNIAGMSRITVAQAKDAVDRFRELMNSKRNLNVPENPPELGEGTRGVAFDIGGGKVLKVTPDEREALAANKVKSMNLKHVYKVHDVFRLKNTAYYCIVSEKLQPLPSEQGRGLDWSLRTLELIQTIPESGYDWEQMRVLINAEIKHKLDQIHDKDERQNFFQKMKNAWSWITSFGLRAMFEELKSAGINFHDFHSGNVMRRNDGTYVIIDLGYSRVTGAKEPDVLETMIKEIVLEGIADTIGITIGRFQPFHKGHAEMVRKLAKTHTKVIVFVAGLKKDEKNPFSYDLRREMMTLSLPDVESKIEVYRAEANGKQTGYLPDLLSTLVKDKDSSVEPDVAATIVVGPDRYDEVKQQLDHATKTKESDPSALEGFDPSMFVVEKMEGVYEDGSLERISGTDVRSAISSGDEEKVRKFLDPHVSSDETKFGEIYRRMKDELAGNVTEGLIREFLKDIAPTNDEGAAILDGLVQKHAKALSTKGIDVSKLKKLGTGSNGTAWDAGTKIFKVTTDADEALAASMLLGKSYDHIYEIYDVFSFPKKINGHLVYGILQEKLTKPSKKEIDDFDTMVNKLETGDIYTQTPDAIVAKATHWPEKMRSWVLAAAEKFQFARMIDDLKAAKIEFFDFHGGNFMKRGDDFVVIDLGTKGQKGDKLKVPRLGKRIKEDVEPDIDDLGGPDGIHALIALNGDVLKQKKSIDVSTLKALGHGMKGVAFDIGDGHVLKVTSDQSEAITCNRLKGKSLKRIARIFDVFKFGKTGNIKVNAYGIVQEKVDAISDDDAREFDRLSKSIDDADVEGEADGALRAMAEGDDERMMKFLMVSWAKDIRLELGYPVDAPVNPTKERKLADRLQKHETWMRQGLEKYGVLEMMDELKKNNVQFADYHSGNLGKRGGEYVIFDLGMSKSQGGAEPPVLEAGIAASPLLTNPVDDRWKSSIWSTGAGAIKEPGAGNKDMQVMDEPRGSHDKLSGPTSGITLDDLMEVLIDDLTGLDPVIHARNKKTLARE